MNVQDIVVAKQRKKKGTMRIKNRRNEKIMCHPVFGVNFLRHFFEKHVSKKAVNTAFN